MLEKQIKDDLISAQKAREVLRLETLRLLLSQIKNRRIELRMLDDSLPMPEEEVLGVLRREEKKRKESAELFRAGNRPELADKEMAEILIIKNYLPAELGDDEILVFIKEARATGATDFGALMKIVMARAGGRADGKKVGELIRNSE